MILNLIYDPSVANAPAGFTSALNSVVSFFQNNFSDPVTVNIAVGYGEVAGQSLAASALGESSAFVSPYSYASLSAALTTDATSSTDASAVASLPASDPTGGAYWVAQAEAKALGLATGSGLDGYVGFSSKSGIFDYQDNDGVTAGQYDFFATAVHEISEVMGRQMLNGQSFAGQPNSYEPLDLFHFSALGMRTFSGVQAGYFSADNGATNLDNFNISPSGDFGDWAASAGHDSFLAFSSSGVVNTISAADMKVMDVLGWDVTPLPDLTATILTLTASAVSVSVNNTGSAAAGSSTAAIYLSAHSIVTSADTLLATTATPTLASLAGDTESASIVFPGNLTPGTYYIGAIADSAGQVVEFNENNNASAGVPIILGNDGPNSLTGTSAANLLVGLAGDDSLNGGSGADTMVGGTGNDSYVVDNAGDVVVENPGEGADTVSASVTYVLGANVEALTLTGTAAINGTGNGDANVITGNAGNNILAGLGGADTLDGGAGVDTATYAASPAGVAVSLMTGSAAGGDADGDVLSNIENLTGSAFNDTLEGDGGNNVLVGGVGSDMLTYEHAAAAVSVSLALTTAQNTGGAGTDTVTLFENLTGSAYGDTLTGSTAANLLVGLAGDDSLNGGSGADTMVGGTGNDSYVVDNAGDVVVENPGEGADTVSASVTYVLGANVEALTLTGTGAINGTGNGDANVITGNAGNNILAGLGGADTLDGGAGVDTATYAASPAGVAVSLMTGSAAGGDADGDVLSNIENLTGSAFNDTLEGDGGNNVLVGGVGSDMLTYEHAAAAVSVSLALTTAQNTGGAGTDTVTLFENLTGSAYGDTLTGSTAANLLVGLAGDDSLNGGSGADTMVGGTGNDSYVVDNAGDVVVENPGEGADTVSASVTYVLGANVEALTLTGTAAINGTGNGDANVITGNAGNNILAGLGGADTLDGGAGVDTATYAASPAGVAVSLMTGSAAGGDADGDVLSNIENLTGSAFNDTLEGDGGNNVLVGGVGSDMLTYEHAAAAVSVSLALTTAQNTGGAGTDTVTLFENLTGSAYGDTLTGSTAANLLVGLAGDDSLNGGSGADTMVGGTGNDSYVVDNAGDVVVENPGEGADTVSASVTYVLGANVEALTLTGTAAINGTGNGDANVITGNAGNNILAGLGGADTLSGGAGADRFVFLNVTDSAPGPGSDVIMDFNHAQADKIDLSGIDANTALAGDQAFTFIGAAGFHGIAGELNYSVTQTGIVVAGDVNGDGVADFAINLTGLASITSADFIL